MTDAGRAVALSRTEKLWCGLRGHYPTLTIEPGYLAIACMECRTQIGPGWRLDRTALVFIEPTHRRSA